MEAPMQRQLAAPHNVGHGRACTRYPRPPLWLHAWRLRVPDDECTKRHSVRRCDERPCPARLRTPERNRRWIHQALCAQAPSPLRTPRRNPGRDSARTQHQALAAQMESTADTGWQSRVERPVRFDHSVENVDGRDVGAKQSFVARPAMTASGNYDASSTTLRA